jgi:hypothetical protein
MLARGTIRHAWLAGVLLLGGCVTYGQKEGLPPAHAGLVYPSLGGKPPERADKPLTEDERKKLEADLLQHATKPAGTPAKQDATVKPKAKPKPKPGPVTAGTQQP